MFGLSGYKQWVIDRSEGYSQYCMMPIV